MNFHSPKSFLRHQKIVACAVFSLSAVALGGFGFRRSFHAQPHHNIAHTNVASRSVRLVTTNATDSALANNAIATSTIEPLARRLSYKIVGTYAHDTSAFTEGLLWSDNSFYESTGLQGHSDVRRVAFPAGRVLEEHDDDPAIFGEGLALANNKLVQLSWQDGRAFIYDRATLKPLGEWQYQGEGWGLTFDGQSFVMSNGSDIITFRDTKTFAPMRTIRVTQNGAPLTQLNELEWINGKIWANVWRTDTIVQINPQNGRVVSYLDLTGILPRDARNGGEDVLNGIAYDAARKRIFVTGKLWPKLFQIEVK